MAFKQFSRPKKLTCAKRRDQLLYSTKQVSGAAVLWHSAGPASNTGRMYSDVTPLGRGPLPGCMKGGQLMPAFNTCSASLWLRLHMVSAAPSKPARAHPPV